MWSLVIFAFSGPFDLARRRYVQRRRSRSRG
jgi:hypothetical protein